MTADELTEVVAQFRNAVDKVAPFSRKFAALKGFPKGCCKDASFLFARVLDARHGAAEVTFVSGQRGPPLEWVTHGWLETDKLIIDVTADQFADAMGLPFVIPIEDSVFHKTWEERGRYRYPGFWRFNEEAAPDFEASFEALLAEMS